MVETEIWSKQLFENTSPQILARMIYSDYEFLR